MTLPIHRGNGSRALAVAGALMIPGRAASQTFDSKLALLDRYIEKARVEWRAPAVAVAIVRADSVILAKGYGVLEAGKPERTDQHTIFAIGSSTKAFTTAALAMLVDDRRLGWDDPAARHLPGWELGDAWVTREITVRDLVTHRAGIEPWAGIQMAGAADLTRDDLLKRHRYLARTSSFRSRYGYNNHMYLAAGRVVENVAGITWDEFIQRRIFEPFGMTRSSTSITSLSGMKNLATPHYRLGEEIRPTPWGNLDLIAPAGSINASVRDMAEWVRLHLGRGRYAGRQLISEAVVGEMHSPQTIIPLERWYANLSPVSHQAVPGTRFFAYGLGWFLQNYRGQYVVQHGGQAGAMRALVGMIPEQKLGVVVLSNLDPANVCEAIMFKVFDTFLGGDRPDWSRNMLDSTRAVEARMAAAAANTRQSGRVAGTKASLALERYVGLYHHPAFGEVRIEMDGGKSMVRFGRLRGELRHWHYDTFEAAWDAPTRPMQLVTFRLDATGRITGLGLTSVGEFVRR